MGCFILFVSVCIREACEAALEEKYVLDISRSEELSDEATTTHLTHMEALSEVFSKAAEADMPTEVSIWISSIYIFLFLF